MTCVTCAAPMPGARSNRRYCSERCRYRKRAAQEGRRPWLPIEERAAEDVGYYVVHKWLGVRFGAASDHPCREGCGRRAQEWAYDHSDPARRVSDEGMPYSTDLSRYVPMCKRCHRFFDAKHSGRSQCGTEGGYYHHRHKGEPTCQPCRDAHAAASRRRVAARRAITNYDEGAEPA